MIWNLSNSWMLMFHHLGTPWNLLSYIVHLHQKEQTLTFLLNVLLSSNTMHWWPPVLRLSAISTSTGMCHPTSMWNVSLICFSHSVLFNMFTLQHTLTVTQLIWSSLHCCSPITFGTWRNPSFRGKQSRTESIKPLLTNLRFVVTSPRLSRPQSHPANRQQLNLRTTTMWSWANLLRSMQHYRHVASPIVHWYLSIIRRLSRPSESDDSVKGSGVTHHFKYIVKSIRHNAQR